MSRKQSKEDDQQLPPRRRRQTWAYPLDGPLTRDRVKVAILGGVGDGTAFSEPRLWETEAGIIDLGELILHATNDPGALAQRLGDILAYYRDLADQSD